MLFLRDELAGLLDAVKSARRVETVASEFEGALTNLVGRLWNGKLTQSAFDAAMRTLLQDYIRDVYIAGFTYGGGKEEDLDDEDESFTQTAIKTQLAYVGQFASDAFDARGDDRAKENIRSRILMWTASVRAVGDSGQASVDKNQVMVFRVRPGMRASDESCDRCQSLLGKKMKWRDIMKQRLYVVPGNKEFECEGWLCVHGWYPVRR